MLENLLKIKRQKEKPDLMQNYSMCEMYLQELFFFIICPLCGKGLQISKLKKTTKICWIDEFKIFRTKNHLKLHYCLRQLLIKISIFLWKF